MPSLDELIDQATTPGDGQLMHGVLLHAIDGKGTYIPPPLPSRSLTK